jgi:hypothetical protein
LEITGRLTFFLSKFKSILGDSFGDGVLRLVLAKVERANPQFCAPHC